MVFELDVNFSLLFCLVQNLFRQSGYLNDNMNEWKRKLTMLLNDKSKQELISREKKDRRDFDDIAILATRMGLYRFVFILYDVNFNAFESQVLFN